MQMIGVCPDFSILYIHLLRVFSAILSVYAVRETEFILSYPATFITAWWLSRVSSIADVFVATCVKSRNDC